MQIVNNLLCFQGASLKRTWKGQSRTREGEKERAQRFRLMPVFVTQLQCLHNRQRSRNLRGECSLSLDEVTWLISLQFFLTVYFFPAGVANIFQMHFGFCCCFCCCCQYTIYGTDLTLPLPISLSPHPPTSALQPHAWSFLSDVPSSILENLKGESLIPRQLLCSSDFSSTLVLVYIPSGKSNARRVFFSGSRQGQQYFFHALHKSLNHIQ